MRNWYTYYGQVLQQLRETHEHIKTLENQQGLSEAMNNTVQDQIVLESTNLEKLENQPHQWINQTIPSLDTLDNICPHMKILLDTVEEKEQFLGLDMVNIIDLSIQEKMSTLSSITTLTIDIQKALCNWTEFQHQLEVTVEAIVEICIQKRPSI